MNKYNEVAKRLLEDPSVVASIGDGRLMYDSSRATAILRESLPQAEASGELDKEDAARFVNEWLWSSSQRRTQGMPWEREYIFDAANMIIDALAKARPAPTAEKEIREALEKIKRDCEKTLRFSTHHKCDYLALIQSINDRLRALLAHEAPKGNN